MSPTELLVLEKGRIPARIVLNEIKTYVRENEAGPGDIGPVRVLSLRSGVPIDTLNTWLGQERIQSVAFDVADNLFCAMGRYHLWLTRYRDYYYGVNLNMAQCECPGCETMIEVVSSREGGGGVRRAYCSQTCRQVAYQIRTGQRKGRSKRHLTGMAECRKGHKRTPENAKTRPDGRVECLVCARENARRRRERRRGCVTA